jgi:hypothetical protein
MASFPDTLKIRIIGYGYRQRFGFLLLKLVAKVFRIDLEIKLLNGGRNVRENI